MFSHIIVGVTDFERALKFYMPIINKKHIKNRFIELEKSWAGWQSSPEPRPLFIIKKPYNQELHLQGNGQMVAFTAQSRKKVDEIYALAISLGSKSEGKPGLRPEYHENYYGAYFRDLDGNKLCIVCHDQC